MKFFHGRNLAKRNPIGLQKTFQVNHIFAMTTIFVRLAGQNLIAQFHKTNNFHFWNVTQFVSHFVVTSLKSSVLYNNHLLSREVCQIQRHFS